MKNPNQPNPVVRLRRERGYSVTIYNVTPAKTANPERRHFGEKYDEKKVRNISNSGLSKT